jgi:hypothetical protein
MPFQQGFRGPVPNICQVELPQAALRQLWKHHSGVLFDRHFVEPGDENACERSSELLGRVRDLLCYVDALVDVVLETERK